MPVRPRRQIVEFITTNGTTTEEEIVAECTAGGVDPERVRKILERLASRGILTESDGNYSLA